MSHQEFDELTSLYALGALDGEDLSRFTAHLAGCDECRRAVAEHEKAAEAMARSLPPVHPSPGAKDTLLARVRTRRPARSFGWIAAAAAGLMVAGILGILQYRTSQDLDERQAALDDMKKQLAETREQVQRLQRSLQDQKQVSDALKQQLAGRQQDLYRLAKMEALIRDIKSQVHPLQGTDNAKGTSGRIVWRGEEVAWTSDLPPLVMGKVYELWALVDGKPVPAGTYDAKGNLVTPYWKVPTDAVIKGFAISLEDKAVDTPTTVVMVPAQ